jgi:hypothetical protein
VKAREAWLGLAFAALESRSLLNNTTGTLSINNTFVFISLPSPSTGIEIHSFYKTL